jgi:shikimate dehydrogenase
VLTVLTLLGVAGFPVGHSRSPAMQQAALDELGIDWRYLRLPLPPDRLEEVVRALPAAGYRGINVTIPHKQAALALADSASPAATAIGAANTLNFAHGQIDADNTDAPGLIAALGEDPADRRALVLGAGGAGRAAVWALREAGADVSVWNRTAERARQLALELEVDHADHPAAADIVVNATSAGLDSSRAALDSLPLGHTGPPPVLVDLVYAESGTELAAWARAGGSRVVDGLEVLVRQGALSLELWTGRQAPIATMRAAVQTRLDPG